MPILHAQAQGQGKDAKGKDVEIPAPAALQIRGPCLQVVVTIEQNSLQTLSAQGKPVPTPKGGLALIDTGASHTCIDEQTAKDLGLPVIDVGYMVSATHEKVPCNIYPMSIITPIVTLNCPRAMGASLANQGLVALIGRDVLQACVLYYNGVNGQYTIAV
jgi:predicted aspartyl protease